MHLPTSSSRRLIGAAAIACAAALAPAPALAATSSPAAQDATASASCATSRLVVWLNVPPGNDYAGGAYYYLEFTNLSGQACTLRGYPGVSAVGLNGRQLGSPAGWGSPQTTTVMLASDRRTADRGYRQLRPVLPAASAGAGNAWASAHSGWAACLPTEPDRLDCDPLPIARMRAHWTGLDSRWPGNAWRSSSWYLNPRPGQLPGLPSPARGPTAAQLARWPFTPDTIDPCRARSRCVRAGAWSSCAASVRPRAAR